MSRKALTRRAVDEWNAANAPGTAVRYWPGFRGDGPGRQGVTEGEALILHGHSAGVYIKPGGFVALSHLEVQDGALIGTAGTSYAQGRLAPERRSAGGPQHADLPEIASATAGERIVIFTQTHIYAGLVSRVGPLVIELIDAGIVYDTGCLTEAGIGEFRNFQSWPVAIRIPHREILSVAVQVQTNVDKDISTAQDWATTHSEILDAASEGERALIFTPTFIYAGLVSRARPDLIELIDAGIVYETGGLTDAASGKFRNFERWPGPIRIPTVAILYIALVEFPNSRDTWSYSQSGSSAVSVRSQP